MDLLLEAARPEAMIRSQSRSTDAGASYRHDMQMNTVPRFIMNLISPVMQVYREQNEHQEGDVDDRSRGITTGERVLQGDVLVSADGSSINSGSSSSSRLDIGILPTPSQNREFSISMTTVATHQLSRREKRL
jgi:hypothetical protein